CVPGHSPAAVTSAPLSRKHSGTPARTPVLRRFYGRLETLDLSRHPMTLSAVMGGGRPLLFRFGGLLVPDTMVIEAGKAVGVKSLKNGQLLEVDYRESPKGGLIQKIFILPKKGPPTRGKGSSPRPKGKEKGERSR
ncbi:MAG: hypothetical protein D084_Lepto4C00225G0001, partial [Leptospirillum sp. Group IV 'UBA BS']